MKKTFVLLLIMLSISISIFSLIHPNQINDDMIADLIEEAKKYVNETTLQISSTNHGVSDIDSKVNLRGIMFETVVRNILEDSHEMHRKYMIPKVDEMRSYLEAETFSLVQYQAVKNADNRDPKKMHTIFILRELNTDNNLINEKIIQPVLISEGVTSYSSQFKGYWSSKTYSFRYEDFPVREELETKNYIIIVKHISDLGEVDFELNWMEIR